MSEFIYQCKGTDSSSLDDLQSYWNKYNEWRWSIKYDGQYVQIHVNTNEVILYTSSGKPYKNQAIEDELLKLIPVSYRPIIFEGEYLGEGFGRLGGRKEAAVVTTLRTAYAKGQILSFNHSIRVFDVINDKPFKDRLPLLDLLDRGRLVRAVSYQKLNCLAEALHIAEKMIEEGLEGIMIKSDQHFQIAGKRVKTSMKFKKKNTVVAEIVDITEGTGKYQGMIGALVCKDSDGLEFTVGSGLTDELRKMDKTAFIGKTVEIKYESKGKTYVMPVFDSANFTL